MMGLADPGEGSNDGLLSFQTKLGTQIDDVTAAIQELNSVIAARPGVWQAGSADAWTIDAQELSTSFQPVLTAHEAVSTAVSAYVVELESIRSEFATLKTAFAEAQSTAFAPGVSLSAKPASALQMIEEAQAAIASASAANDELLARRTNADNALVSAINSAMPETWNRTYQALQSAGVKDFSKLTDADIAKTLQDYATKALKDGSLSATERDVLQSLLDGYSDDPTVMDAFFAGLGGEKTIELLNAITEPLGNRPYPLTGQDTAAEIVPALALAQSLREGLASASSVWGSSQSDSFMNALLANVVNGENVADLSMIGYLFSGPPYQGETLTTSAAELFDKYERDGNPNFAVRPDDWHRFTPGGMLAVAESILGKSVGPDCPTDGTLFDLYSMPDNPSSARRTGDPISLIFETLGHYPAAAAEFLGNGEGKANPKRIDYWFGERAWTVDGFEGVSALLLGVQTLPGGPMSGTLPYDDATAKLVADITGYSLDQLATNPTFTGSALGNTAAASLATVLSAHLPGLLEHPLNDPTDPRQDYFHKGNLGGLFDEHQYAWVKGTSLATLFGVVQQNGVGKTVMDNGITTLYVAAMQGLESIPQADFEAVFSRLAALQGAYDGSGAGRDRLDAAASDEAVQSALETMGLVIGSIPVGGGFAGALAWGGAVAAGERAAVSTWTHDYADVVASQEGGRSAQGVANVAGMARVFWHDWPARMQAQGVEVPLSFQQIPRPPEPSPDPSELMTWYENNREALDVALAHERPGNIAGEDFGSLAGDYDSNYGNYQALAQGDK